MFQNETDNYPIDQLSKVVLYIVYSKDIFVGYQKKIFFKNGHYHEKNFNKNKQLISKKKYSSDNVLSGAEFYNNNKIVASIITDDSTGIHHEIVLDKDNNILTHRKYDEFNRFIGGNIYNDNKIIGRKEIRYTESGTFEKVYDYIKHKEAEIKINPQKYLKKTQNTTTVVLETHFISHKKNGEIYETIYDGTNRIIGEPKLIKTIKDAPKVERTEKQPVLQSQTKEQPSQKPNKLIILLHKIRCFCKIK